MEKKEELGIIGQKVLLLRKRVELNDLKIRRSYVEKHKNIDGN